MVCSDPAIFTLHSNASSVSREKRSEREGMSTMIQLEVEDRFECLDQHVGGIMEAACEVVRGLD